MFAKQNGMRESIDLMFTRGNLILKDSLPITNINNFKLDNFNELQIETLKHLR
jgi:hypothetical protein